MIHKSQELSGYWCFLAAKPAKYGNSVEALRDWVLEEWRHHRRAGSAFGYWPVTFASFITSSITGSRFAA